LFVQEVYDLILSYTPEGIKYITSTSQSHTDVWHMLSEEWVEILPHPSPVLEFLSLPDNRIASRSYPGSSAASPVRIWDMTNLTLAKQLENKSQTASFCLLPNSCMAIGYSSHEDGAQIMIYDLKSYEKKQTFALPHPDWACRIVMPTSDDKLLCVNETSNVYLWDLKENKLLKTFKLALPDLSQLVPLTDHRVVVKFDGGQVQVLCLSESNSEVKSLARLVTDANRILLLPDGRLVIVSLSKVVSIWDMITYKCILTFPSSVFSPFLFPAWDDRKLQKGTMESDSVEETEGDS